MNISKHIQEHIALGVPFNQTTFGSYRPTLVVFGDSIPEPGASLNSPSSFVVCANVQLGSRFQLVDACTSSNTTTQMLARFSTDVAAVSCGAVVFMGGTNDPSNSISAATTISNIGAMANATISAKRVFVCCTIMPTIVCDDVSAAGSARRLHMNTVNDWIRRRAEKKDGFVLCDTEGAMSNTATGIPIAAYSTDGTHPNYVGAMQIGRALAEVLDDIFPDRDSGIWSAYDPLNLIGSNISFGNGNNASGSNGTNLVTGITGTGPNGWSTLIRATGAGVGSGDVARTTGSWKGGEFGRMAVTATSAWDGAGWNIGGDQPQAQGRWDLAWAANTAYTYNIKRRPVAGDNGYRYVCIVPGTSHATTEPTWPTTEGQLVTDGTITWMCIRRPRSGEQVYGECEVQTSSLSGNAAIKVFVHFWDTADANANVVALDYDVSGSSGSPPDYLPATMRFRTPLLTIPSDSIRYLYLQVVGYGAAGSTFNMDVTRAKIYNYTQQVSAA